jgi:hypothetical protein
VDFFIPHISDPRLRSASPVLTAAESSRLGDVNRWCEFEGKSPEMRADLRRQMRRHTRHSNSGLYATVIVQILKLLLSSIDT